MRATKQFTRGASFFHARNTGYGICTEFVCKIMGINEFGSRVPSTINVTVAQLNPRRKGWKKVELDFTTVPVARIPGKGIQYL